MGTNLKQVNLNESQKPHFERIVKILEENISAIDISPTGSGKTYVTAAAAQKFGLPLLVISPCTTSETVWPQCCQKYGIPLIGSYSYETFRTNKGCQPKHGFLCRKENKKDGPTFSPTQSLVDLIKSPSGVLIVFDEGHKNRNESDTFKACRTVIHTLRTIGGKSRCIILSASLFDKPEQSVRLMNFLGFINNSKLITYNRTSKETDYTTFNELTRYLHTIDPVQVNKIVVGATINNRNVEDVAYYLFIKIIKPRIVSSMPPPESNFVQDVANYVAEMNDEDQKKLIAAIDTLSKSVRYNEGVGTAVMKGENFGAITKSLMAIECAKIETLARKVTEDLESNKNNHVVVFVNHIDSIMRLKILLDKFSPLILDGSVRKQDRNGITESFNRHDSEYRLLISNTKVGGESINLHDTHGDFPRHVWVIPTYNLIQLLQAVGRTHRCGVKSQSCVRMLYGKTVVKESSILSALSKKSEVVRDLMEGTDANNEDILLPGEYNEIDEEESRRAAQ
jgi:hypothetical protein